jgi:hypothetical protein
MQQRHTQLSLESAYPVSANTDLKRKGLCIQNAGDQFIDGGTAGASWPIGAGGGVALVGATDSVADVLGAEGLSGNPFVVVGQVASESLATMA